MWTAAPITFDEIVGWVDDDHGAALQAFQRQALRPSDEKYKLGDFGIDPEHLDDLVHLAGLHKTEPRSFFENHFTPVQVLNDTVTQGKITGFYEPECAARLTRGGRFQTPLLRRPDDLLALNNNNRPKHMDVSYRFGRINSDNKIVEYHDRAAINAGAIDHDHLAIAFVEDPIEAFFIHIQGAARLRLEDETIMRVTYDGKSGHPFTAIGKLLIDRGEISAKDISMQSIKHWLRANVASAQKLMEENRSYIFFKQVDVTDIKLGPIAAAKVPLTAGRSLAVDRLIHTFGTPIFINADHVNGAPCARLMIAQETGTAIVGVERGDIFFGSGDEAGEQAGAVNSKCKFTVLVPRNTDVEKMTLA